MNNQRTTGVLGSANAEPATGGQQAAAAQGFHGGAVPADAAFPGIQAHRQIKMIIQHGLSSFVARGSPMKSGGPFLMGSGSIIRQGPGKSKGRENVNVL